MNKNYRFNWISPSLSHQEIEGLFHWFNAHLKDVGADPLKSYSELIITPLSDVKEIPDAISVQFQIRFHHAAETEIKKLREKICSEIFSLLTPTPRPIAVSLRNEQSSAVSKKLVVFDMDSTLINQEVIDEMAKKMGFYEQVSKLTEAAMQGELSFDESFRARCKLLAGMKLFEAMDIIPALSLSPGGESLLASLRAQGIKTAIVSGGFQFILRHFQKQYFIDHVYGNELELDGDRGDEYFTGLALPPIVDAIYKQKLVANLKEQYQLHDEQIIVVGDGANDILMMKEAGTSVSFCGKPKLAAITNTLILDRNLLWIKALL